MRPTGPVVSVLDGDTIEMLHNHHAERIRLSGIDCPEKGQAYGKRAKQAASELAFGKEVTLQTHGLDKYGRTLGDVFLLGSMRRGIPYLKGWGRRQARQRKAYGPIRSQYGSGWGKDIRQAQGV